MVMVFREVRRVLTDDGTLWLNIGDCFATGAGSVGEHPGGGEQGAKWAGRTRGPRPIGKNGERAGRAEPARVGSNRAQRGDGNDGVAFGPMSQPNRMPIVGLKAKDLVMIPARLALALQADGWYVRMDIIWQKPNPMPESIKDRPTKSHEYVFLMSKSEQYYYDADAIAEPAVTAEEAKYSGEGSLVQGDTNAGRGGSTRRFKKAGKRPSGWCTTDEEYDDYRDHGSRGRYEGAKNGRAGNSVRKAASDRGVPVPDNVIGKTSGAVAGSVPWEGTTRNARSVWTINTQPFKEAHFATFPVELPKRCILAGSGPGDTILDPFGGAGTTGLVADRLGRHAVLIELNPKYAQMAERRIHSDAPLFADVGTE